MRYLSILSERIDFQSTLFLNTFYLNYLDLKGLPTNFLDEFCQAVSQLNSDQV